MNLVPTGRKVTDKWGIRALYRYPVRHICYASRKPSAFATSISNTNTMDDCIRSFLTLRALPYPASKINYWD